MDSSALLFSAFISSLTAPIANQFKDVMGVDLESKVVEYQGQPIDYQYKIWLINAASVCASQNQNALQFSKCSTAAKSLFVETCSYLQSHPDYASWKYPKLKNMYCSAATTYKPTVAMIAVSSNASPLDDAKAACNRLVLEAMGNGSPDVAKRRKQACDKYESLGNKEAATQNR
jgi:hypothetical protein